MDKRIFIMSITNKKIFATIFYILIFQIIYGKNNKQQLLKEINANIYYYQQISANKLDELICNHKLTEEEINRTLYYKGILNYYKELQDSALLYLEPATHYYSQKGNNVMHAKCLLGLAWIANATGYSNLALSNYLKVTEIIKDSSNLDLGNAYLNIALHYYDREKPYKDFLSKGFSISDNYGDVPHKLFAQYISCLINNSPNIYSELNYLAKEYEKKGFKNKSANMLRSIANKYYNENKFDSALFYSNLAIKAYRPDNFGKSILSRTIQLKAKIFYEQNLLDSALTYFNKVKDFYVVNNAPNMQYYPYWYISRIDTIQGNFEKAFKDYNSAIYYKNKLNNDKDRREAKLSEISSVIADLKFNLLENKAKNQRYLLYWISSISLIIIFSLAFSLFLFKKQRKVIIKNRELQNINNNMEEKLLVLQEQKNSSFAFVKSDSPATNYAFVYNETLKKLRNKFPDLNNSQLMYALMFAQNMSNDMICELQNVQSSSIRMARLRIRRILNLENDRDLQKFFSDALK